MTMIFSLMVAFMAHPAEMDKKRTEMKRLLPLNVEGYQTDGNDEFYDRHTAFRYMDGAAELYRSYSFKLLMVRRYLKQDQPSLLVELFDMGSSEDAFGIFSYQTEEEEVNVGQGSEYGGGLLRFWKGKYFVNVYSEKETPSMRKDVIRVGQAIARNIQEGKKPQLIQSLPQEGLNERSLRYFHSHLVLNHHYFLSHQNILHLGERTNGILATYPQQGAKGKTYLLLIQYPSVKLARGAFQSFLKAYMPESGASTTLQTENGKWISAKVYRQYILVVFDAPSQEKAEELVSTTLKGLEGR